MALLKTPTIYHPCETTLLLWRKQTMALICINSSVTLIDALPRQTTVYGLFVCNQIFACQRASFSSLASREIKMDKRQKIRLAAMMLLKNHFLSEQKLKMLLLKLLNNLKIVHAVATTNLNLLLQVGIAVGHSEIRDRQLWKFERKSTFWESEVPTMDDDRFKETFRLNRASFQIVCEKVQNMKKSDTNMRLCIPLEKRVAIALYALGSPAEYKAIGSLFGVGRSTVGEIVIGFCQSICNSLDHYINSYPPQPQEIQNIVDGFEHLGIPQCFGAVDTCHIEIQPKKEDIENYRNIEGWCSVVLLASCDHRSKFTYVNIGSSGRYSDSHVFENSALKKYHENFEVLTQNSKQIGDINVPLLLIADSSFCLSQYLMKPFPDSINQSEREKTFNNRLARCHRIIENAFSQLKARFRRIYRGLQVAPKNGSIIIQSCCILHNFLIMEQDEVLSAWLEDVAENVGIRNQPQHPTNDGDNDATALAIRNAIALSITVDETAAADVGMGSKRDCGEGGDGGNAGDDGNGCDSNDGKGCDSSEG